jgi:uncharacterized RDD family membrane protein YckC
VDDAWRREVVSRVQQHRARRRRPADPNALELDFSADTPHSFGADPQNDVMPPPPARFHEIVIPRGKTKQSPGRPEQLKVIRFPRTQPAYIPTVDEVTLDELEQAAPAPETPRIMEAYEPVEPIGEVAPRELATSLQGQQMDLLPNFSDIQLEPEEARVDHDLEVIPRPAPLSQRFMSGLVDAGIVFIATGAFALTFVELAEEMPHSNMAPVCLLVAGGIFWLVFQYIFLTYRRATPGMSMAQLELCTYDGKATTMLERQTRAAASALSGFSIGLGYAWALVDEDRLGWHDRISQTHLRAVSAIPTLSLPKGREPYLYDDLKD